VPTTVVSTALATGLLSNDLTFRPRGGESSTRATHPESPTDTTPDAETRSSICWHRWEVRRAPAPDDRARGGRDPGHLP